MLENTKKERTAIEQQKKFKNTIMASFQAKIDWKMPRKREYKNYRYVSFPSDG